MPKAYILVTASLGREKELLDQMKAIPEVKEVHRVLGVYDLILRVEANSLDSLKQAIQRIRSQSNVHTIITMICPGA